MDDALRVRGGDGGGDPGGVGKGAIERKPVAGMARSSGTPATYSMTRKLTPPCCSTAWIVTLFG